MGVYSRSAQAEDAFAGFLLQRKPGDTVTLTIIRGGKMMDVKVTLGQAPMS